MRFNGSLRALGACRVSSSLAIPTLSGLNMRTTRKRVTLRVMPKTERPGTLKSGEIERISKAIMGHQPRPRALKLNFTWLLQGAIFSFI